MSASFYRLFVRTKYCQSIQDGIIHAIGWLINNKHLLPKVLEVPEDLLISEDPSLLDDMFPLAVFHRGSKLSLSDMVLFPVELYAHDLSTSQRLHLVIPSPER